MLSQRFESEPGERDVIARADYIVFTCGKDLETVGEGTWINAFREINERVSDWPAKPPERGSDRHERRRRRVWSDLQRLFRASVMLPPVSEARAEILASTALRPCK